VVLGMLVFFLFGVNQLCVCGAGSIATMKFKKFEIIAEYCVLLVRSYGTYARASWFG
jgi:hypothetical protein